MTTRKRAVRRIECEGGCGLWWFHPTPEHPTKPVRWCPRCQWKRRLLGRTDPLGRSRLLTVAELRRGEVAPIRLGATLDDMNTNGAA